jgi:TonB family protein
MRRMILASLVLIPAMAHAELGTAIEGGASASSSTTLEARLSRPASFGSPAFAAALDKAAASGKIVLSNKGGFRQTVKASVPSDFTEASMREGGTLGYTLMGSAPVETSLPRIVETASVELTPDQLAVQPAVSDVAVRLTVDENGLPRNLFVVHSAGKAVDQQALKAIAQYRFKPATMDNQPVVSQMTLAVKIEKN